MEWENRVERIEIEAKDLHQIILTKQKAIVSLKKMRLGIEIFSTLLIRAVWHTNWFILCRLSSRF